MIDLPIAILAAENNPIAHVTDKPLGKLLFGKEYDGTILGLPGEWIVSNVTLMLLLSGLICALILIPAARRIATGKGKTLEDYRTQGIFANMIEAICLYLREDVFKPVLGDQTDRYTPMLWTLFWFILVCNLVGLVPLLDFTFGVTQLAGVNVAWFHGIGGTATQSIWVTGALAVIAFLFYNINGLVKDPVGYFKHLTGGAPIFMWPIMVPVEIIGMFVKPFALALRLFANMTGGHIIIAVLLSFVVQLIGAGVLGKLPAAAGYGMALVPLLGAIAINGLEVMVAFIQAFIFTFLTCLFLGQLVVHEHEEHEEHGDHEHAAGVDPHAVAQAHDVPLKKASPHAIAPH